MPKPPSNADSIFFAALEKTDPKDRAAYLDQACGQDAKLRKRIGQLLAAQPNVGAFLEEPLTNNVAGHPPSSLEEGPGASIGPYKLLQQIGEGGFGVVYMAEQEEPLAKAWAAESPIATAASWSPTPFRSSSPTMLPTKATTCLG